MKAQSCLDANEPGSKQSETFKLMERRQSSNLIPVSWKNLFSVLPKDLLGFLIATVAFGLCAWFEIFRYLDQLWFGRIHLVGNRDTAIYLQWELAACVVVAVVLAVISRVTKRSNEKLAG